MLVDRGAAHRLSELAALATLQGLVLVLARIVAGWRSGTRLALLASVQAN